MAGTAAWRECLQTGYTAQATAPAEFQYTGDATRTHNHPRPEGTPMGTFGWINGCYVNTRGEAGPYSEAVMFVVN